ncbi:MAG: Gfo/Idh/MocA family oxidoreductase [Oscillospiraceae bacterium]|nr:Gfo/Idh/MocA family oxidoreductase [Oscillospiraceae bacterium]MDD4367418.1 Gfo/Idh/MocA family oxidoreductase [Oscillospiraceae bacterium]
MKEINPPDTAQPSPPAGCFKWGILGCGTIAAKFAEAIALLPDAVLHAAASRDLTKAEAFARQWGASYAYGSYEQMLADSDHRPDAVYVATIHPQHLAAARLVLQQGIPLLVEKPLTLNAAEARELIQLARQQNCFMMEAMWSRFLPAARQARRWVEEGRIGQVRLLQANYGYNGGPDRRRRHLNRDLGGGTLLDIGIYNLEFTGDILGYPPQALQSQAWLDPESGADTHYQATLIYPEATAQLAGSVMTYYPDRACILGDKGRIELPHFHEAQEVWLYTEDGASCHFCQSYKNGFQFEIAEVMRCVRAGLTESPAMSLAESLAWQEVMDQLRQAWGLVYPTEKAAGQPVEPRQA